MNKKTKDRINNILRIGLVAGVAVFLIMSAQKGEIITPDVDLNNPFEKSAVEAVSPEDAASSLPSSEELESAAE